MSHTNSAKTRRIGVGTRVIRVSVTALVGMALFPSPVDAYMGPGAGLSAMGALLSLVAAGVFSLIGFIWFPLKRAIRMLKSRRKGSRQSNLLLEARRLQ